MGHSDVVKAAALWANPNLCRFLVRHFRRYTRIFYKEVRLRLSTENPLTMPKPIAKFELKKRSDSLVVSDPVLEIP